jgi:hypothetical protein
MRQLVERTAAIFHGDVCEIEDLCPRESPRYVLPRYCTYEVKSRSTRYFEVVLRSNIATKYRYRKDPEFTEVGALSCVTF